MPARHYRAGSGGITGLCAGMALFSRAGEFVGTVTVPARRNQAGSGYHGSPRRHGVAQSGRGIRGDVIRAGPALPSRALGITGLCAGMASFSRTGEFVGTLTVPARPGSGITGSRAGTALLSQAGEFAET